MFNGPLAETSEEIALPDIEPNVFRILLQWVSLFFCNLFYNIFLLGNVEVHRSNLGHNEHPPFLTFCLHIVFKKNLYYFISFSLPLLVRVHTHTILY
jgi:hypothetical protein